MSWEPHGRKVDLDLTYCAPLLSVILWSWSPILLLVLRYSSLSCTFFKIQLYSKCFSSNCGCLTSNVLDASLSKNVYYGMENTYNDVQGFVYFAGEAGYGVLGDSRRKYMRVNGVPSCLLGFSSAWFHSLLRSFLLWKRQQCVHFVGHLRHEAKFWQLQHSAGVIKQARAL